MIFPLSHSTFWPKLNTKIIVFTTCSPLIYHLKSYTIVVIKIDFDPSICTYIFPLSLCKLQLTSLLLVILACTHSSLSVTYTIVVLNIDPLEPYSTLQATQLLLLTLFFNFLLCNPKPTTFLLPILFINIRLKSPLITCSRYHLCQVGSFIIDLQLEQSLSVINSDLHLLPARFSLVSDLFSLLCLEFCSKFSFVVNLNISCFSSILAMIYTIIACEPLTLIFIYSFFVTCSICQC